VLNHARARHVHLAMACLADGEVEVVVEDDGVGIAKSADLHHYGMTIMEERTRTLSGRIAFTPRAEGGTRVSLVFRPASRRSGQAGQHQARPLRRLEA
jgi:two-component system nitrate/nitrite sensor histidine kinase NarX